MTDKQKEIDYYGEIKDFISDNLESNFRSITNSDINVFWGIGELKSNLEKIVKGNPEVCKCVASFAKRTPPLNLDVFALITNGVKFEILILEVKLVKNVGLKEWSQLLGYSLVSGAKYGILLNIDGGCGDRLKQLLLLDKRISNITTLNKGVQEDHLFGYMTWNSFTRNFEYENGSTISTLADLTRKIASDFI